MHSCRTWPVTEVTYWPRPAIPKVIVAFVSKYTFWNDANVVPWSTSESQSRSMRHRSLGRRAHRKAERLAQAARNQLTHRMYGRSRHEAAFSFAARSNQAVR